jgi:hypothetical protein
VCAQAAATGRGEVLKANKYIRAWIKFHNLLINKIITIKILNFSPPLPRLLLADDNARM